MKEKKKVVIITNIPAPYRVDLFQHLQNNYMDYTFYIVYSSESDKCGREWTVGEDKMKNSYFLQSKVITIHKKYDDRIIIIPKGVWKILDDIKPDVVVGSEYNPTIIQAMLWCKLKKIKYVSWTDGTPHSERNIGKIQKILRKFVIKNAKAYIASSTASMDNQLAFGAKKDACFISFLTVKTDKYRIKSRENISREDNSPKKVLYVGSLIERKGVDLLLQAMALLSEDYVLTIVGNGSEQKQLLKMAEELGISHRINWRGFLEGEELLKCYEQNDIFVLPTREDCFGLVILEAICANLPVVCSKWADGSRDLIEPMKNGIIVDPYDKEEFAKMIRKCFEKPDIFNNLLDINEKKIQQFSFESVGKGYMDAVEYAISSGKKKE